MLSHKKGGVVLSYVMLITNVLVKFIYTPFLLRNLGQEEYGLYSLIITIIGYLTLLDLGFGSAIVRYTIKYKSNQKKLHELYGMMSLLYLTTGIVALILCFVMYLNVDSLFGQSMTEVETGKMKIMVLLSGINLLFTFPLQIASSVITAYEKFIFKNGVNLAKVIIQPAFMVLFIILFDFKSVGLIVLVTLFNFLVYLAFYIYAYKKLDFRLSFKNFDTKLLRSIAGFSSSMFLLMIFEQLQFHSGQFVLGVFKGTKDVAVWGIAMVFVLNYRSISTAITNVSTPSIVDKVFKNDKSYVDKSILKFVRIQTYILLLVLLNYILFGYDFLELWAGDEYIGAYKIGLTIMIPMFFALLLDFGYIIQIANNSLKYRVIALFSSFILSFTLIYYLFGIDLNSYALVVSLSIIAGQIIFMLYYILHIMKFDLWSVVKEILQISFVPLIFTIIYYFLINKVGLFGRIDSDIFELILSALIYNIGIIIIYWFLCFTNEEKRMIFNVKI